MIEVSDSSLYTGYTKDLQNRLEQHRQGKGSKYVRGKLPFVLRYTRYFDSKSEAMKYEISVKKLKRTKKLELIKSFRENR